MTVVGVIAVFFGFCFVAVTPIVALLRFSDIRLLRRLRAAPRWTCADLLADRPLPRSVLLTGRTAAGRDGELRSPAYGTTCIWYETEVSSDGGEQRMMYLQLGSSAEAIRIEDGTGSVYLDLRVVEQVGTVERIRRVRSETTPVRHSGPAEADTGIARLQEAGLLPEVSRPRFGQRYLDLSERTIPAGLEISVLARPERTAHDESVLLRRRGQATTGTPDGWIAQLEEDNVTSKGMILVFPLIGTVLAGLGVGLIWVGAL